MIALYYLLDIIIIYYQHNIMQIKCYFEHLYLTINWLWLKRQ